MTLEWPCNSSRCVIRASVNERGREREQTVHHTSQTTLCHDSQDEDVSRRRSGAEVHGKK